MSRTANTVTHPTPSNTYHTFPVSISSTKDAGLSISPSAPVDTSSSPRAQLCGTAEFGIDSNDIYSINIGNYSAVAIQQPHS